MPQKSRPDPANGTVITADEYEGISLGSFEDGVIGTPSDTSVVFADSTGRQVKVRAGKLAGVRGYTWQSDPTTDEIINNSGAGLPANTSGNPRIDRLVLRLDRSNRTIRTVYLQGTPAATPAAPALTQNTSLTSGLWDFPLARWQVANGYTTVAAADIVTEAWYRAPGGGGVTLCTSTSRPFGAYLYSGWEIYETDMSVTRQWNGSAWMMTSPYRQDIVLSASASTVQFSSLPAGLRSLRIKLSARGDNAVVTQALYLRINNDAGTNYYGIRNMITNATAGPTNYASQGVAEVGSITGSTAGGTHFAEVVIDLAGWSRTDRPLNFQFMSTTYPSAATSTHGTGGGVYNVAAAYTSIQLLPFSGSFIAGSEFHLEAWD